MSQGNFTDPFWKKFYMLHAQLAGGALWLADARYILLCIYAPAILEATFEMLSALYCLKVIVIAMYLCDKLL